MLALGGQAYGVIAIGGVAIGALAMGGFAAGIASCGGMTLALILAFGGFACAPLAVGGLAMGYLAIGGQALGVHIFDANHHDSATLRQLFTQIQPWLVFGSTVIWLPFLAVFLGVTHWAKRRSNAASPSLAAPAECLSGMRLWLSLIDTGGYAQSWENAAPYFRRMMPREEWVTRLESIRQPLGKLLDRKMISEKSRLAGQWREVKFEASFEGLPAAIETVTFGRQSNGEWLAVGYLIRPIARRNSATPSRPPRAASGSDLFAGFLRRLGRSSLTPI